MGKVMVIDLAICGDWHNCVYPVDRLLEKDHIGGSGAHAR
jgi:hypothetical protein